MTAKADAPAVPYRVSDEFFESVLGESFHTAFRKGVEGGGSAEIHQMISAMPSEKWGDVLAYVVWCLDYMGLALVRDPSGRHYCRNCKSGHLMTDPCADGGVFRSEDED